MKKYRGPFEQFECADKVACEQQKNTAERLKLIGITVGSKTGLDYCPNCGIYDAPHYLVPYA